MQSLIVFVMSFFIQSVFASIPVQQSGWEKNNKYIDQGVFVGGFEHGLMTLTSFRTNYDKDSKVERLVFEVSSGLKKNTPERPGFFHISVQKKTRRILMSLQHLSETKVSHEKLKKLIEQSHYFSGLKIFEDPFTKNMTLEIPLKESTKSSFKVEVFELSSLGQPGRIVIDAKEF